MVEEVDPLKRIKKRFDYNTQRVSTLINIYKNINDKNIPSSQKTDILRSATVFVHATLEDLLRELMRWKAPIDNPEFASALRFTIEGQDTLKKDITVSDLLKLGKSNVKDIVDASINSHLERRSYNDEHEIAKALTLLGLKQDEYKDFMPLIVQCVKRRHNIVHRGDRPDHSNLTHGAPKHLKPDDVVSWNDAVGRLGAVTLEKLGKSPKRIFILRKTQKPAGS